MAWTRLIFVNHCYRCASVILNRSLARALGGFDSGLHQLLDMDLFWRVGCAYGAWLNPDHMAYWRCHPDSATACGAGAGRIGVLDSGREMVDTRRLFGNMISSRGRIGLILVRHLFRVCGWAGHYFIVRGELRRLPAVMATAAFGATCLVVPWVRSARSRCCRQQYAGRRTRRPLATGS